MYTHKCSDQFIEVKYAKMQVIQILTGKTYLKTRQFVIFKSPQKNLKKK